jgi:hypothetical protein
MSRSTMQAQAILDAYKSVRGRLSDEEMAQAIRTGQVERLIAEAQTEAEEREEAERLAEVAKQDNAVRRAIRSFETYPAAIRARLLADYRAAGAPWGTTLVDAARFVCLAPRAEYEAAFAPYGGAL